MRLTTAIIVILNLLTCPFLCGPAEGAMALGCADRCLDECDDTSSLPAEDAPCEGSAQNCFCVGAPGLAERASSNWEFQLDKAVLAAHDVIDGAAANDNSNRTFVRNHGPPGSSLDRLIALQSFLI